MWDVISILMLIMILEVMFISRYLVIGLLLVLCRVGFLVLKRRIVVVSIIIC